MDIVTNKAKDLKSDIEIVDKKKQEYKMVGNSRRPFRNAILYAYDVDNEKIYIVNIQRKAAITMLGSHGVKYESRANINPKHPIIWALNEANARRKLKI